MVKKYTREEAEEVYICKNETVDLFHCGDCGFEFNAIHTQDDVEGGYVCPLCEIEELKSYIGHLGHENQLLYGRLNQIIALAEKEIK